MRPTPALFLKLCRISAIYTAAVWDNPPSAAEQIPHRLHAGPAREQTIRDDNRGGGVLVLLLFTVQLLFTAQQI